MSTGAENDHHHGKKGCVDKLRKMSGYIDGELETPARRSFEEHLANCPPCLMVLKSLRKTLEIFRHGAGDRMPEDLAVDIKERIAVEIAKEGKRNG